MSEIYNQNDWLPTSDINIEELDERYVNVNSDITDTLLVKSLQVYSDNGNIMFPDQTIQTTAFSLDKMNTVIDNSLINTAKLDGNNSFTANNEFTETLNIKKQIKLYDTLNGINNSYIYHGGSNVLNITNSVFNSEIKFNLASTMRAKINLNGLYMNNSVITEVSQLSFTDGTAITGATEQWKTNSINDLNDQVSELISQSVSQTQYGTYTTDSNTTKNTYKIFSPETSLGGNLCSIVNAILTNGLSVVDTSNKCLKFISSGVYDVKISFYIGFSTGGLYLSQYNTYVEQLRNFYAQTTLDADINTTIMSPKLDNIYDMDFKYLANKDDNYGTYWQNTNPIEIDNESSRYRFKFQVLNTTGKGKQFARYNRHFINYTASFAKNDLLHLMIQSDAPDFTAFAIKYVITKLA